MNDKPKILIVDDIPENIHVLMNILKDDYAILAATSGYKAIELVASEQKPDLILLDIMMPDMDGYEVCKRIKENKESKNIPIIFVTALSQLGNEAKGFELGAVDYIIKPIVPFLVKSRVDIHMELKLHRDNIERLVEKRTHELKVSQEATIEAMGLVAEHRDPETGGHIKRTKDYVKAIAIELAKNIKYKDTLTIEMINCLYIGAPLHDIGKVSISDNILLKPSSLTEDEFEIMKTHAIIGENTIIKAQSMMSENPFLNIAKDIAGAHHEKWDGSGYPRGLKGENIPLAGRIMALADVFDALVSKRTYKEAFDIEKVFKIIKRNRGSHFDPDIVDCFFTIKDQMLEIVRKHKS